MAKKYTVEEFRQRLMAIADPKKLGKSIMTPLRKGQRDIGYQLKLHYWSHPLGKKVWEWYQDNRGVKSGPIIHTSKKQRTRWSNSEQAYIAKIEIDGIAKKIEIGGRLEKHVMWGRSEFKTPGVIVSKKPAFDRIVDAEWAKIVPKAQLAFNAYIEETL